MISIISTLVIGLVIAFLATQNATPVTLHLGDVILTNIPLFVVVLVAILIGSLVASGASIINLFKSKLTIMGQRGDLKKTYKTVDELKSRITQLESENSTLREQISTSFPV